MSSDERLGRCSLLNPCAAMRNALRDGYMIFDHAKYIRDGGNTTHLACPWCDSLLQLSPGNTVMWDERQEVA